MCVCKCMWVKTHAWRAVVAVFSSNLKKLILRVCVCVCVNIFMKRARKLFGFTYFLSALWQDDPHVCVREIEILVCEREVLDSDTASLFQTEQQRWVGRPEVLELMNMPTWYVCIASVCVCKHMYVLVQMHVHVHSYTLHIKCSRYLMPACTRVYHVHFIRT